MLKSDITVTVLEAAEGYRLTQSEANVEDRIFAKKLYLAKTDSPDNWKEVPESEMNKQ